jgi:hypothetical protein
MSNEEQVFTPTPKRAKATRTNEDHIRVVRLLEDRKFITITVTLGSSCDFARRAFMPGGFFTG